MSADELYCKELRSKQASHRRGGGGIFTSTSDSVPSGKILSVTARTATSVTGRVVSDTLAYTAGVSPFTRSSDIDRNAGAGCGGSWHGLREQVERLVAAAGTSETACIAQTAAS